MRTPESGKDFNFLSKKPEDIKKWMECCSITPPKCNECPANIENSLCDISMLRCTLAYIEQLEAKVPKWISVEERLPDIDAEVLIYTDKGLYDAAQYSGGERFWALERNPDCWVTALGVTHWMPLPEPPKETGKDG